jgi:5'-AMP-activated protein kinase regulatory beta subunit
LHQYKFIVDGEWRFSPEDPSIPDANGNINNYIDTTNFHPMIDTFKGYSPPHAARKRRTAIRKT